MPEKYTEIPEGAKYLAAGIYAHIDPYTGSFDIMTERESGIHWLSLDGEAIRCMLILVRRIYGKEGFKSLLP